MPWYLEIMSPMGHWSPQLWTDRPSVQTIHGTDYLRSTGGHSPRVRAVQEVPEHLAGAGLKAVQTALSPDRVEVEVAAPEAKPVDLSPEALDAQVAALNAEAKGWGDFCSGKSLLGAAHTIAAQAAENEALQREVNEQEARANENKARASDAEAEVNNLRTKYEILDGGYRALVSRCKKEVARAEKAEAERDAAMAGAVRVCDLEWRRKSKTNGWVGVSNDCQHWHVDHYPGLKRRPYGCYYDDGDCPSPHLGYFETPEAAKAAAQADYERRILAAIEPHPAERDREALVAALEWYGENARLARLIHSEGDAGRYALSHDGGERARKALATPAQADALAAVRREARAPLIEALDAIEELNKTGADEDGHRWDHSDLIAQEIAQARQAIAAAEKEPRHG